MSHSESTSTYAFSLNKDRLVFVVDADLQSCRVIAAAIKFEGYEVLQIHNVLDLFAKLQDRTPDAVIINSRIGDESGVTAIQLMQQRVPLAVIVMIQDTADLKSATAASGSVLPTSWKSRSTSSICRASCAPDYPLLFPASSRLPHDRYNARRSPPHATRARSAANDHDRHVE